MQIGLAKTLTIVGMATALLSWPASAEDITLKFTNWASAEAATRGGIEQVIAAFEKANPGIKIESEAVAFPEMTRQLVLRIRSGNPPDVAQISGNDTFVLASSGGLEPLTALAGDDFLKSLRPGIYQRLMVDNQLIAIPWNQAPAGLWYNKKIMAEAGLDPSKPPATIDELNAAMAAIKKARPDVIVLGLDTTNRAFSLMSNWPWMKTFGAIPTGEGATGGDSAEMKAYLTWMRENAAKGYLEPGRKIGEFRPLMAQGKVAFLWDQVLLQGIIQASSGMDDDTFYGTFGVTAMPAGAGGGGYSFEGGHQLVMFGKSEKKEAAWKFIQYLVTNEEAAKVYTIGTIRSIPSVASFKDESVAKLLDTPVMEAFSSKIIPTISPQPFGPKFAEAATAIMAGVQEAVTSDAPIDTITSNIQSRLGK